MNGEDAEEGAVAERIRLAYVLTAANRQDAIAKALDIVYEQTVELPRGTIPASLEERVVGRVDALDPFPVEGQWKAVLSYDPADVGEDLPQLLNLAYGNISLQVGIRLVDIQLPAAMLGRLPGPGFGIEGLRRLCGAEDHRALLCVALKPVGLTALELADLCLALAVAGIDIVKDDHGLANQPMAPFAPRVARCQEAVAKANAATGGHCRYFPNVTGPVDLLAERLALARDAGCRGVLVSPLLLGPDTVRWIAEGWDLAILAHPALAGAYFQAQHGIAPDVLLGTVFRMIGSDGVIYPNEGGRFPFARRICEGINRRLRAPLGTLRPAFPVPGGGIDAARVPYWIDQYGVDTLFLVGSSLYGRPDVERAARHLVETVRRHCDERRLESDQV